MKSSTVYITGRSVIPVVLLLFVVCCKGDPLFVLLFKIHIFIYNSYKEKAYQQILKLTPPNGFLSVLLIRIRINL
jgi:hypothetical protein